ncbi:IS66 Orf2 like protein [Burkholderia sp. WP9]|uniref:IS66 family insertion sequence element accessory protein TnpB n=1 Tax=Burkholderia sp. WP9 TaxID=1500263 RepID=UPI0008948BAD|nr:IS66 Orf2 like protein [Burkholderia sp. WP9]
MIGSLANTRIWVAAGFADMRCGFDGLAAKVQTVLAKDPFLCDGAHYVSREPSEAAGHQNPRHFRHIIFEHSISLDALIFRRLS